MIREQMAMPNEIPVTQPASGSNVGKFAIALVIVGAIGAFFYFDLSRFLSLDALKQKPGLRRGVEVPAPVPSIADDEEATAKFAERARAMLQQ